MKLLTLFMALMLVSLLAMNPQLTNLEQDMLLAGMLVKVMAGKLELAHKSKQQDQRVPELANMDMHLDLSLLVDPLLVVPVPGNQRAIKLEALYIMGNGLSNCCYPCPCILLCASAGYAFVSPYGGTRIRTVRYKTDSSASGSVTTITPASGSNTDGGFARLSIRG